MSTQGREIRGADNRLIKVKVKSARDWVARRIYRRLVIACETGARLFDNLGYFYDFDGLSCRLLLNHWLCRRT